MSLLISIVGGFAGGVLVRSVVFESWWPAVFMLLLAALIGAFVFLKPRQAYTLGAAFCLFAALGIGRAALFESPLPQIFLREVGGRASYNGVVVADPDVRDATQRVQIKISEGDETTRVLAVAPRHPSVTVGEQVRVSGTLALPEPFATDSGREFRYDKYLERDGVRFLLEFASIRTLEPAPWYSVPAALAKAKHAFLNGIADALPEPHASLSGGIVLGGKSGLGTELKDAFTRSGLVHIVVLSGHNVMIVASWVIALFALTPLSRRLQVGGGALALLIFVGIAGFSATAIRASLMALIALYARASGRTYAAGRALLFVILLMLIWNPLYLVFDPGFGLSVVATAGLIWFAPIIEIFLQGRSGLHSLRVMPSAVSPIGGRNALKNAVREAAATALAAQIAVLPLLLYFTGNLSLVSIPANVIAALIVPFAMGFAYLAGFAGMLLAPLEIGFLTGFVQILTIILGIPAYIASGALIYLAELSAALPYAAVTLFAFPFSIVVLAYAALIYLVASKRFSITPQFKFAKKASI